MLLLACVMAAAAGVQADVTLEDFAGGSSRLSWKQMNDPVMGGKSIGTFEIDKPLGAGIFKGTCAIVPSLKAPGFITARANGPTPDISACKNLALDVKSGNSYNGFFVSFGTEHYPPIYKHFFARGYKSPFVPPVGSFQKVVLPLSGFSNHWDDKTGLAITTCADDPKACPTQQRLKDLQTITIWAEGVEGDVELQIKSIVATDCDELTKV